MKTKKEEQIVHEVVIHYKRPVLKSMKKVCKSEEAQEAFRSFANTEMLDLKEFFWVMFLTPFNSVLAITELSKGGTMGTVVNIKEILQLAIKLNCTNIIICHNHPSGNLSFSETDIRLTKKIKEALDAFDMTLLDHIIITSEGYASYSDEGIG